MGWFGRSEAQQEEKSAAHKSDGEIERRYGGLINSRAFLYAFVDPEGTFLLMNRGMRVFLGPAIPDTLIFCCAPEQRQTLQALLREARNEPVAALISLLPGGADSNAEGLLWMEAEFSPAELRGVPAVQVIGMDVTEWVRTEQKLTAEAKERGTKGQETKEPPRKAEPEEPRLIPSERTGILNAISGRAAVVNSHGVCVAANAPFILSFGETDPAGEAKHAKKVVGSRLSELIPEDCPENIAFHRQFSQLLPAREGALECRLSGPEGEVLRLEVRLRPVDWAGLSATMLTCEDVTALRRTQEQLERATSVDCATGILNRQGMERLTARRVERAFRDRTPLSLILLDVDGLRRMNETEGYAAVDRMLKTLPTVLKEVLAERSGDVRTGEEVIGRWGGDEFMVLTSRPGAAARTLANALRDRAHAGAFNSGAAMTLSVGVAELREDMDVSTFVAAAFDAMTAARRSGGNRTVLDIERMK